MEFSHWSLAVAIYVYPVLIALIVFRWLAIQSYKRSYGNSSQEDYSRLASFGRRIADSESLKFSIIYTFVLIVVFLLTLQYSIMGWNHYNYPYNPEYRTPASLLVALPVLLLFLCVGVIYVTLTSQGLSWWDARIISFRFYGSRNRISYLKSEIHSLVDEIDLGIETYRAFLTIERLFKHEFQAGKAARKILGETYPEMYQELESSIIEEKAPSRKSSLILVGSVTMLGLSFLFLFLGVFINSPLTRNDIFADTLFTVWLVSTLMWMIVHYLELPELKQDRYRTLKQTATSI